MTMEFVVSYGIVNQPSFSCWVGWVLKKGDQIIFKVKSQKSQYNKKTHKYGIKIPKIVEKAIVIVCKTDTTFLSNAIAKETTNVWVAFNVLANSKCSRTGFKHVPRHMVFTINMEDFTHRAKLVVGDAKPVPPPH